MSMLAVEEHPVELRGDARDLLHVGLEPVEDGRHVHVGDAAEADHRSSDDHRRSSLYSVSR